MREAVMMSAMAFMASLHMRGYDTCPIGGFDPDALRAAFDVSRRFDPVVVCPAGCRLDVPVAVKRRFALRSLVALDERPELPARVRRRNRSRDRSRRHLVIVTRR